MQTSVPSRDRIIDDRLGVPNTLKEGENVLLKREPGDTLWVIASGYEHLRPGHFAFYQRGMIFPGSKLYIRSLNFDFYQWMFVDLLEYIENVRSENHITKVVYIGFSAGGYASLVLGLRGKCTHRIVAFVPQIQLNAPLTIADSLCVPRVQGDERFDPRYMDMAPEIQAAKVKVDIILGTRSSADAPVVATASKIRNPLVTCHFLKTAHDLTAVLDRRGDFERIMSEVANDDPISLAEELIADDDEVSLTAELARISISFLRHNIAEIPTIDDSRCDNPAWWEIKSRIRNQLGDPYGAIADITRAISLAPENESSWVCAGNYWQRLRMYAYAEASFKKANTILSPNGPSKYYNGALGLALLYLETKAYSDAEWALGLAYMRGAPPDKLEPIVRRLNEASR